MANPYYPPRTARETLGYSHAGLANPYRSYAPSQPQTTTTTTTTTSPSCGPPGMRGYIPQAQFNDPFAAPQAAPHPHNSSSDQYRPAYISARSSDSLSYKPGGYPAGFESRISLGDGDAARPLTAPTVNFAGEVNPERPSSPLDGVYEDRPPKWEKLSPEQRKIAKQFPKDLDVDGTSMWGSVKGMIRNWRSYFKWKYLPHWIALVVVLTLVILMTVFHKDIIKWLTPVSKKIKSVSWGWVIPVAILFVISFPPLFGHEIVAILCGVVYGLWVGFGIVSLGTFIGEVGNFYAFMFCLSKTAEKYERKNLNYGCMAHIVREGGFKVVLLARLSAIPGHFTTAVFATVGMSIWTFAIAAILSMPKQLAIVYLGVALEQSGNGTETTKSKIVQYVVLIISFIITLWAAHYLYRKMELARPLVQARLKQRRYTMLSEARKANIALENTTSYASYGDGGAGDISPVDEHGGPGRRPTDGSGWSRWAQPSGRHDNYSAEAPPLDRQGMLSAAAPLARNGSTSSISDAGHPNPGGRSAQPEEQKEVLAPLRTGTGAGAGADLSTTDSRYRYASDVGSIYDVPSHSPSEDTRHPLGGSNDVALRAAQQPAVANGYTSPPQSHRVVSPPAQMRNPYAQAMEMPIAQPAQQHAQQHARPEHDPQERAESPAPSYHTEAPNALPQAQAQAM